MEPEEYFIEKTVAAFKAQNFEELKAACGDGKFTDEVFPPNDESICKERELNWEKEGYANRCEWKRLSEVFDESG